MATKPKNQTLTKSAPDIVNAIRNNASVMYKSLVPVANPDNVKEIGAILNSYPQLQNEFLNALVNRIGRVLLTSKMYDNPWSMFKKGLLEFGETIEEIFVNLAKPFQFDPAVAETQIFKREIPDVRSAFHIMNYQKFYKATIQNDQLRQAFLSWQGITDLIAKIVDAMYTGANYDEFQVMKYMLCKNIVRGNMYPVNVDVTNPKSVAADFKAISNDLEFMKTKYNVSGVHTTSKKDEQYLIVDAQFDATMDVEVLASAFNMDKAEFMGHRVLVDSFAELDTERLAILFNDDPNYVPLTDAEIATLGNIKAVIVDKDWFMIFDNFMNFTEQYNGEGLYWNYWYHVWKTFSVSPFANAIVFTSEAAGVTSVTVSPSTATVVAGGTVQLSATVVTTGFAPQGVTWSSADETVATVDADGLVTVKSDATSADTVAITATSVYDSTKSDSATITVG